MEYKLSEIFDKFFNNTDIDSIDNAEIANKIAKTNNVYCRKVFYDTFTKIDVYSFPRIVSFLNTFVKNTFITIQFIDPEFFGTTKDKNNQDVPLTYDLFFAKIFSDSKLPTHIKMQYLTYTENEDDINNSYTTFNNAVFGG